jgi:hypothetical protein
VPYIVRPFLRLSGKMRSIMNWTKGRRWIYPLRKSCDLSIYLWQISRSWRPNRPNWHKGQGPFRTSSLCWVC